uniref:NADH-ubiquinone oxidoreductase chain 6 n=1 Tax=Lanthanaphalara mira TaxID=2218050 RepID=A0A344A2G7_9HEMI|nr:NADH dehydrogenase subunit 6 [Lanthanaphalara mira]AWU48958.1 NADH dehydrogenase subunit 6 [Lanthanaphalara mira]
MLKFSLIFMFMNSIIMPTVTHPLFLGLLIILQTIMVSIITRLMSSSSWLPLTMFLVVVGGLMVIFMYSTSITSNNIFTKNNITKYFLFTIMIIPLNKEFSIYFFKDTLCTLDNFNKEFFKMFSEVNWASSVFMFYYLLMALLMLIKMINLTKGPMRKKY